MNAPFLNVKVILQWTVLQFLFAGLVQVLAWRMDLMGNLWYGSVVTLLLIGIGIFSGIMVCRALNEEEHPGNPIWRNLAHLAIICLAMGLLLGVLDYILFVQIDPEAYPRAFNEIEAAVSKMMENYGASDEDLEKLTAQYDQMEERFRTMGFMGYIGNRLMGNILFAIIYLVIGWISGSRKIRSRASVDSGIS